MLHPASHVTETKPAPQLLPDTLTAQTMIPEEWPQEPCESPMTGPSLLFIIESDPDRVGRENREAVEVQDVSTVATVPHWLRQDIRMGDAAALQQGVVEKRKQLLGAKNNDSPRDAQVKRQYYLNNRVAIMAGRFRRDFIHRDHDLGRNEVEK